MLYQFGRQKKIDSHKEMLEYIYLVYFRPYFVMPHGKNILDCYDYYLELYINRWGSKTTDRFVAFLRPYINWNGVKNERQKRNLEDG